jgi:hypothetical protein
MERTFIYIGDSKAGELNGQDYLGVWSAAAVETSSPLTVTPAATTAASASIMPTNTYSCYILKRIQYFRRRTRTDSAWANSPSASAIVSTISPIASSPERSTISTEVVLQKWFTSSPE